MISQFQIVKQKRQKLFKNLGNIIQKVTYLQLDEVRKKITVPLSDM